MHDPTKRFHGNLIFSTVYLFTENIVISSNKSFLLYLMAILMNNFKIWAFMKFIFGSFAAISLRESNHLIISQFNLSTHFSI